MLYSYFRMDAEAVVVEIAANSAIKIKYISKSIEEIGQIIFQL